MKLYTLILDRSGSMSSIWDDITSAVNHHIKEKTADRLTSLLLFDTGGLDFLFKYHNQPEELNTSNFQPRGGTPLRDAIMHGINTLVDDCGDFLWQEFVEVEVTIFTDGEENSSRIWSSEQVATAISHLQETYGWKFNFIGAGNQSDVEKYASQFAIKSDNCVGYTESKDLARAFATV